MNENLPLYQIVNYAENFENNKSKERDRCSFVCVPNKHGGTGLSNLLSEPNGHGLYGLWMLILQLCSRQRKPREGYLTDNGRRDGRRLGAEELAKTFRVQVTELRRCLHVLSSPRVGFIRLIEGTAELGAGTEQALNAADAGSECPSRAREKEGKNEEKKEGNSLSKGEIETSTEDRLSADDTSLNDLIRYAEAKRLVASLSVSAFGKKLRDNDWSSQIEHQLNAALPIKREDWELIAWFYTLAQDHEIFTITYQRQSLEAVIENLSHEIQKIRSARKMLGMHSLHDKTPSDAAGQWTPERVAVFEQMCPGCSPEPLYPGCGPGPFWMLGNDLCEEINKKVREQREIADRTSNNVA